MKSFLQDHSVMILSILYQQTRYRIQDLNYNVSNREVVSSRSSGGKEPSKFHGVSRLSSFKPSLDLALRIGGT